MKMASDITGSTTVFRTCVRCAVTLQRAFAGITEVLRREHQKPRERFLADLVDSLNQNGFDTVDAFPPRLIVQEGA